MEIYILSNKNILSNENIFSSQKYFYRMKIYFYRMQIYFYRMKIIFIEFCYISATIKGEPRAEKTGRLEFKTRMSLHAHIVLLKLYNGTCLLQVAEHVKNDNQTRRVFSSVMKELNIELTPSTRCDLYNRFLRKIYNIRCNEFIRADKCLEEHHCQQTQDRQVMLREKLKVQLQK